MAKELNRKRTFASMASSTSSRNPQIVPVKFGSAWLNCLPLCLASPLSWISEFSISRVKQSAFFKFHSVGRFG